MWYGVVMDTRVDTKVRSNISRKDVVFQSGYISDAAVARTQFIRESRRRDYPLYAQIKVTHLNEETFTTNCLLHTPMQKSKIG